MSARLAIKPERQSYSPGETVSGTIEVLESVNAKELTVALEYRDWTSDYHSVSRTVPAQAPLHVGNLEQGQSLDFGFALPADALPNQTGRFGSTAWGLHARVAHFGPDLHVWLVVHVAEPDRARHG